MLCITHPLARQPLKRLKLMESLAHETRCGSLCGWMGIMANGEAEDNVGRVLRWRWCGNWNPHAYTTLL